MISMLDAHRAMKAVTMLLLLGDVFEDPKFYASFFILFFIHELFNYIQLSMCIVTRLSILIKLSPTSTLVVDL